MLWQSLQLAGQLIRTGEPGARLAARMRERIEAVEAAEIDYVALVDPGTLQPIEILSGRTLAALAVRIETRD